MKLNAKKIAMAGIGLGMSLAAGVSPAFGNKQVKFNEYPFGEYPIEPQIEECVGKFMSSDMDLGNTKELHSCMKQNLDKFKKWADGINKFSEQGGVITSEQMNGGLELEQKMLKQAAEIELIFDKIKKSRKTNNSK